MWLYSTRVGKLTATQNEAALRDQIEKLRSKLQDVESQTRARELEAKQRVESMKTQAVFSVSEQ